MVEIDKTALAVLVGLALVIVSAILLFSFYPLIISLVLKIFPWLAGVALLIVSFILLWGLLYSIVLLVIALYYALGKPMRVEESDFSIDSTKESGERQSGTHKSDDDEKKEN